MIIHSDICRFFDLEARAAKADWEALMALPLEERIRRRKAIRGLRLDPAFRELTEENRLLLKLRVGKNLADFKEGECVLLHREEDLSGVKCEISRFEGEEVILIEIYPFNLPGDFESYYEASLVLDKDLVDLRQPVYNKFLERLPESGEFWRLNLVNRRSVPVFGELEACRKEVDGMLAESGLQLQPKQYEALLRSVAARDYYLIQGPPGTGKSFILGLIMREEICYFHHKVVVIGPNHLAVNNTLRQLFGLCPETLVVKVGQPYNAVRATKEVDGREYMIRNVSRLTVSSANASTKPWCIGVTPHALYTGRARDLQCDTLIIDEAGQMTIPLALMGMVKARKVILAGDHRQLPPIVTAETVGAELSQSVFQRLIGEGNCTMLDTSFRMCGPLCDFVSELFYEGRLKAMRPGCGKAVSGTDPLYSFEVPIVLHDVEDDGEQLSDREAEFVVETVAGFLAKGLPASEIAVLSPFRAQAANVRRHLRECEEIAPEAAGAVAVDTVDRMQGQEREVIIYSMAAGSLEYMSEMAEFLFSPNKMNVAFSRAKSKLIVAGHLKRLETINPVLFPHLGRMLRSHLVEFV